MSKVLFLITFTLCYLFVAIPYFSIEDGKASFAYTLYPIFAQANIADVYDLSDNEVRDGDIVTFTPEKGIMRSSSPFDIHMFGVIQATPSAVYRRVDGTGVPIARQGSAKTNVTTLNGPIKSGDHITSSEIPGFGAKSTTSGQVVGVAVENFGETDGQPFEYQGRTLRSGQILVAIDIGYAELTTPRDFNRLFSYLGSNLLQNIQDPKQFGQAMKYILSGLIVLVAIIFSMIILLKSIPKSIEAIGRNPLARRSITLSIALNVFIVMVLTGGAMIAALVILRL